MIRSIQTQRFQAFGNLLGDTGVTPDAEQGLLNFHNDLVGNVRKASKIPFRVQDGASGKRKIIGGNLPDDFDPPYIHKLPCPLVNRSLKLISPDKTHINTPVQDKVDDFRLVLGLQRVRKQKKNRRTNKI